MKLYVTSDVHGFYSELKEALDKSGFFTDTEPHKLVLCGDMMDRGEEAVKMQKFMMELLERDELIFVKGNHELLMKDMIENFDKYNEDIGWGYSHHVSNGTWDTAKQLAGMTEFEAFANTEKFLYRAKSSDFYSKLIPASVNYFETENYVFCHGFLPVKCDDKYPAHYRRNRKFSKMENWREATQSQWNDAMWLNGMEMVDKGFGIEKTIVVGHFHTSWGRAHFEGKPEFGKNADFSPYYYEDTLIAIDSCVAYSGKVNVLVIEDNL
jgi:serine/threonine protein phosphatase 1